MTVSVIAPREWTRLHIITPVINGAQAALVFFVVLSVQAQEGLRALGEHLNREFGAAWLIPLGLLLLLGVIVGITFWQWTVNQFRITDDAVEQRQGLLFRQQRQARLDRLQAVDVAQPLVARIFGFAELKVEVAGGKESGVRLRYLKLELAEALRNEILDLAAGRRAARSAATASGAGTTGDTAVDADSVVADGAAPESSDPVADASPFSRSAVSAAVAVQAAPAREVYRVPIGRLIGSVVVSWPMVMAVVIPVSIGIVTLTMLNTIVDAVEASGGGDEIIGTVIGVAWAVLAVIGVAWAQINAGFNFKAAVSIDGIGLQHGMLDTRRQTVPPGRVQALKVRQSLLWRGFDWWKISLNVAGYQDDQQAVSTLLPVGSRQEALYAMWLVLPDLGDPDPTGTISAALSGKRSENGFTASPPRSMVYDVLQWRHRGVKATDRALLIRRGLLVRELFVIPHERTQSLAIRQGPLQRLLKLADLEIHSTNGPVRPVAQHLALADAQRIFEEQAVRARDSHRRQTPEQWAAAIGIEG